MWIENPLSALSVWVTYSLQIAFAYLMIRGLCVFVRKAQVRVKMWGGFLAAAVAYWAWLCCWVGSRVATNVVSAGTSVGRSFSPGWSWGVSHIFSAHLNKVAMGAAAIYAVALCALGLQLGVKAWSLRRFLRAGRQASPELRTVFGDLCGEMKVGRCRVRLFEQLRSPAAAGWWRPVVLLPAELVSELDGLQLENIVRHELVHIRRRDYLWDRLAAIGSRIVFFHPAAWLAHRRLRWERELACDEAVVQHYDERRLQYAECLTTLARWWFLADKQSPGAIGFASSASLLGTRVRALLHEPARYSGLQRVGRASLSVLLLAFTAACLPALRLTLYWAEQQLPAIGGIEASVPQVIRKATRLSQRRTLVVTDQKESANGLADGRVNPIADESPAALSVIQRPAMPVFVASEESRGPTGDVASATATPETTSTGGGGSLGLPGGPPTATKAPSLHDAVIGAIGAGVGVIRSRTSAPSSGGGGAGGGAPSGGSSGGGGEGPDHFVTPGP